jgi:cytidine deaminase
MTELIETALKARSNAYCPYSGFAVGAALLCSDGKIYSGCNIENASFSPTNCAERTAFFKAISDGKRSFTAIAVCGGKVGEEPKNYCPPCGVCRQVMTEFCDPDFNVIFVKSKDEYEIHSLGEILPFGFGKDNL